MDTVKVAPVRRKGETAEEKKQRKALVKEERKVSGVAQFSNYTAWLSLEHQKSSVLNSDNLLTVNYHSYLIYRSIQFYQYVMLMEYTKYLFCSRSGELKRRIQNWHSDMKLLHRKSSKYLKLTPQRDRRSCSFTRCFFSQFS